MGLYERVLQSLSYMVNEDAAVDIITFCESPEYLNIRLYPRQNLILKIFYRLELTDEQLQDVRNLVSCNNKYAKLYFPGLEAASAPDLDDEQLREILRSHQANVLEVIAGRRGSKSVIGALIALYELYLLYRDQNLYATYTNLLPGQEVGIANVATTEEQALVLFKQLMALVENSPWWQKTQYDALETKLRFPGRSIVAQSLHSNSAGIRGRTLKAIFLDEFCHFNMTTGKSSDQAMWEGLKPSVATFGALARVVVISSPRNQAGKAWEIAQAVMEGKITDTIYFQLATWEMNPTVPRSQLESEWILDPDFAEMEYGAQWAQQVGQEYPPEAVDACVDRNIPIRKGKGDKGVRYTLHVDLSLKRDPTGLVLGHYDKEQGKVVFDRVEEFDPSMPNVMVRNGEIDQEEMYNYIVNLQKMNGFTFNSITFDHYNSAWLAQKLKQHFGEDIVEVIQATDKWNRESHAALRSCVVQGMVALPNHHTLIKQLKWMSRTVKQAAGDPTKVSNVYKIDAPPGCHDDLADAAASCAKRILELSYSIGSGIHLVDWNPGLSDPTEKMTEEQKEVWNSRRVKQQIERARHHKECTDTYCHYLCPVAREWAENG
jgi:hypothetical protein